ncbi:ATP-dependent zinc protease family protein [Ferrimonas aestuarii]|uniref:Retropepsin-like aspartic endopeptidase domain-containing protein n=1 Tax=Ferrimonas aestuarii TaxID=2569539 RepID=A0A4U1BWP9_9GAMM|nr:ATP-dependent zinc protease [Ferrimonas aestuarii]TKB57619.1 hypothetical protein FCL42_04920 [Ferrimonas aestuarii]
MSLRHFVLASALISLSGCALTQQPQTPAPTQEPALSSLLAKQHQQAISAINSVGESAALTAERQQLQADKLDKLNEDVAALSRQVIVLSEAKDLPVIQCPEVEQSCPLHDKLVFGEVEKVTIEEVGFEFDTRVDTGAASSSLDAGNIILFERDGNQWARFEVMDRNQPDLGPRTVEAPVVRFVQIKKGTSGEPQRRPVIKVRLSIGDYHADTELNLNDRSHLEYPLLLGRKFIKDIAVVDVSQQYVQSATNGQNGAK